MLFGYLALNEQALLARLRPAGETESIVVIAESMKQFVLCKSSRPDFTSHVHDSFVGGGGGEGGKGLQLFSSCVIPCIKPHVTNCKF